MADEPLFDPSLKKRKKKTVAFTEDPLGPEADPTAPPPETIESTTVNGDAVDLGPTTAHEAMKEKKKDEEDEFKAMFGDLKKKKKKKEIPLDLVRTSYSSYHSVSILPSHITGRRLWYIHSHYRCNWRGTSNNIRRSRLFGYEKEEKVEQEEGCFRS